MSPVIWAVVAVGGSLVAMLFGSPPPPDFKPLSIAFVIVGICGVIGSALWSRAIVRVAQLKRRERRRDDEHG